MRGFRGPVQETAPLLAKGEITNNRDANKWVKPTFRKGWELKL